MTLFDPINSPSKKQIFWMIFFLLLFMPITKSFFVNINKLVKSVRANTEYKKMLIDLDSENKKLKNKVRYYKTNRGMKTLIKERLNKVEEGEVLIKFDESEVN